MFNFISLPPEKVNETRETRNSKVSESGPSLGAISHRKRFFHTFFYVESQVPDSQDEER